MKEMRIISEKTFGNVKVVLREGETAGKSYWGVVDLKGNEIVPFGKYAWIDGFEHGLARVRTQGIVPWNRGKIIATFETPEQEMRPKVIAKWGIINEKGEEVLPCEYDDVWNFYGKDYLKYTTVEKDGEKKQFYFETQSLNPPTKDESEDQQDYDYEDDYEDDYGDDYGSHYGKYAGSYAQEVMGYSDDVIDDAFEGDPDLYWNID